VGGLMRSYADFNRRNHALIVHPTLSTCMSNVRCLEDKLKCELDRARSADLIEGVETSISAAGPQTAG
jgi:hypothetical protein